MNIRRSLVAFAGAALLTLSGCSGEETSSNETSLTSTTTSSSTSSSATTSSSESSSPDTAATEPVQETGIASAEPAATFVECIYGGGSWTEQAYFSDGSYGFHPDCKALRDQQVAENPYTCPQTDARVPDLSYCTPDYLNAPVPEELVSQQEALAKEYEECLQAGHSTSYCMQTIY